MNFLLLSKDGTVSLKQGDPYEYIYSVGCVVAKDYFNDYDTKKYKNDALVGIIFHNDDYSYGYIVFNQDGSNMCWDGNVLNNNAFLLRGSLLCKGCPTFEEIHSDVALVKLSNKDGSLSSFTTEEVKKIKEEIKYGREWLSWYLGRNECN